MNSGFAGKVVVVTGAASGLGKAISAALIKSGAKIVLIDKNSTALSVVQESLGSEAEAKVADVTNFEHLKELFSDVIEKYERIDYLFNNAGIVVGGETRDVTIEDWREVIEVNLMGVVNGCVAVYPVMVRQGFGHIINTSSIAGIIPMAFETSYTASKFGVAGISQALRTEGRALGVKVSAVYPACVDTPIWDTSKIIGSKFKRPKEFLQLFTIQPKFLNPDKAATLILKGVLKNKASIFTDSSWRIISWVYKFFPNLVLWVSDIFFLKNVRSVRS